MLLTIEKVLILKSVSIFSETPEEELAKLAALVTEEEISIGEQIITKGEQGTCMYIIVNGLVLVHDGERAIYTLGDRSVFGELAVLDPEPRSADVTALEDTLLLRIDREPLYEFLADNTEVLQNIVAFLCRRMRGSE